MIVLLFLGALVLPARPGSGRPRSCLAAFLPVALYLFGNVSTLAKAPLRIGGRAFLQRLAATAGQCFLGLVFLGELCFTMLDAAGRTLWRLFITRRDLLEWESAAAAEKRLGNTFESFLRTMWPVSLFSVIAAIALGFFEPVALVAVGPFLLFWFVSPLVAYFISRLPVIQPSPLTSCDRLALRRLARQTCGFFEAFVTAADHWLPPDNYRKIKE